MSDPDTWAKIADSIRIEADISSRFGQYDRLHEIADHIDALATLDRTHAGAAGEPDE